MLAAVKRISSEWQTDNLRPSHFVRTERFVTLAEVLDGARQDTVN